MKTKIPLLLCLSLLLFSCVYRENTAKAGDFNLSNQKYSFIQQYEYPSDIQLSLFTKGGNIHVKGYEGNRVEVAFVVTDRRGRVLQMSLDELKKYASFILTKKDKELTIRIEEIHRKDLSVGFDVKTPLLTACKLNTSGGNLSIQHLTGDQELNTSGGNVKAEGIEGALHVRTSGGNIGLEQIKGNSDIVTSGGNIGVENLTGDLNASTSGGNIGLNCITGTVNASTSGGNIGIDDLSGTVSARTSGGNVSANLNKLTGDLSLHTDGGMVHCTLPDGLALNLDLSGQYIRAKLNQFDGMKDDQHVSGTLRGGGKKVRLQSSGGVVNLDFK